MIYFLIDFVNLKIKPIQYFRGVHRDRRYMHVFIAISNHIYIYMSIRCNIKKKMTLLVKAPACYTQLLSELLCGQGTTNRGISDFFCTNFPAFN
jgi:hypothetical protein